MDFYVFVKFHIIDFLINASIKFKVHNTGKKITENLLVDLRKFLSYRCLRDNYKKHDTDRKAKETEYGLNFI
jgi:hypothetical protein